MTLPPVSPTIVPNCANLEETAINPVEHYLADIGAIDGYQVIKMWLSYREKDFLGRGLSLDEVNYVTEMARRLAALAGMQAELDGSYKVVAGRVMKDFIEFVLRGIDNERSSSL